MTVATAPATESMTRQVFRIAWPVVLENFLQTLLGLVNLWMIARIGVDAIAGAGNAQQYLMVGLAGLGAVGMGSSVLISHSIGAGDSRTAERVARQAVTLGLVFSLVLSLAGYFFAYPANLVLGVTPEVAEIGAAYLRIIAGTSVGMVGMILMGAVIRGTGDSRTPMQITLVANVLSAAISYWLIFGGLGVEPLGVTGAAWGMGLARVAGAGILLWILVSGRVRIRLAGRAGWLPNLSVIKRMLGIGLPSAAEQLLISGGFLVLTGIIAQLGTNVLAAHRIVFQFLSISGMLNMGFGVAATTLVGMQMGAKRPDLAEQVNWIAMRMGMAITSVALVAFWFFGEPLMLLFAPGEPEVVHYGAQTLKVVAFAQPFFAISNIVSGSLRGAGDTRMPMYLAALGMWLIRLPGSYFFGLTLQLGLVGVYGATVLDAAFRSVLYVRRFQAKGWHKLDVLKGIRR
jgi:multidrug resistance protein, MATE family